MDQLAPRLDVIQESKTLMLMDQEDQDAERFPFPKGPRPPQAQGRLRNVLLASAPRRRGWGASWEVLVRVLEGLELVKESQEGMGSMEMEQSPLCNKPYWHLGLIPPSQECGDPPLGLPAPPAESFLISAWRPNMCHPIRTSAFGGHFFGGPSRLQSAGGRRDRPGEQDVAPYPSTGDEIWPEERPE
ncbi:hypothetical protein CMUS01_06511 [Colletotrichum musicola]|uniref:Uncharacterized protein n=1 Tax=Colletotrichum musicola TaxID=2175873 RepID=A0A8H6KL24_9PEZI|nr:hypothetical protein CMUS01_06511 [Colletotrichum musicola]